jgi:hypothetical protein
MENEKFKLDQSVKQSQAEIERLENRGDACEKTLQQMKTELEEKKELHEE